MYILVGMLVVGLIANLMVRPLADKWFMTDDELANERPLAHEKAIAAEAGMGGAAQSDASSPVTVWLAWMAVGIPLAWGVYRTLLAARSFFN
jgi:hypothetical protein